MTQGYPLLGVPRLLFENDNTFLFVQDIIMHSRQVQTIQEKKD